MSALDNAAIRMFDELIELRAENKRLRDEAVSTRQQAEVLASRDRYIITLQAENAHLRAQVERDRPLVEAAERDWATGTKDNRRALHVAVSNRRAALDSEVSTADATADRPEYESTWVAKRPSEWTEEERAWVRHIVFGAALDSEVTNG